MTGKKLPLICTPGLLSLLLLFPLPGIPQEIQPLLVNGGVITGRVMDEETRSPLAYANVYLDTIFLGSETGTDGKYIIRYVPSGTYRLRAERLGYESFTAMVTVDKGRLLSRDITLKPTGVAGSEVVVTAARKEQTVQMAPASVVILRARDLETRPITTFDQVLESVPGVAVYRSAGISTQSLSIRGSSDVAGGGVGNRVLLMIDGRPALTPDAGGAYWGLIPTHFIERVEIVKGAFSSLYGSTAMGGVINVITRRPSYRSITTIDAKYGYYEKAPPDRRYTDRLPAQTQLALSHSGVKGRLSYLLHLSRKQSDGHAENTAYEFYDVYAKLLYDLRANRNLEISLGGGYAENDYPHTWLNSTQPLRVREKFSDDRQLKRQFNADIHYWAVPNTSLKYASRFYYYLNAARSFFNSGDPLRQIPGNEPFGAKTVVDGQKFGNISQLDIYLNDKNYLIAGIDVQIDKVNSAPDSIMYGNQQVNNIAAYVQNEMTLHPKLIATAGLRYDRNHLVGWHTFDQLSPKIAFVYTPYSALTYRLLFGQAFRAPTIAERFFKVEIAGGTLFDPNPLLNAEKMDYSLEAGLRWQIHHNADIDVALYRYHYKDMIYWVDIAAERGVDFPFFQVRNLNSALMQGIEATIDYRWRKFFHTSLNYTYLDARDQSTGRSDDILPYKPKHTFNFNALLQWDRYSFNLNGRYRSKVDEVFLYPLQAPEAFFVINAKATAGLSTKFRITIGVNNLFDTAYEELARYRMPGRNWMFGAQINF